MTEQNQPWGAAVAARIGLRVAAVRAERRVSAQQLADRLAAMGHDLSRVSLSQLENGHRGVSVPDLLAIAWALDTSPLMLLVDPEAPRHEDAFVPGAQMKTFDFIDWWSAERFPDDLDDPEEARGNAFAGSVWPVTAWRDFVALNARRNHLHWEYADAVPRVWTEQDPERGRRIRDALEDALVEAGEAARRAAVRVPWHIPFNPVGSEDHSLEAIARRRKEKRDGDD